VRSSPAGVLWQSRTMERPRPTATPERLPALEQAALARPRSPYRALPSRTVVIDVERQRLLLVSGGRAVAEYPVSTAAAGVGGEEGSFKTPPGWHRIHARIGAGCAPGTVFESRIPTGEVWRGEPREADLILTRVITLEGLEEGVNRGPGRDSLERYIYIHGTNHEPEIGAPASHGCVRMRNADLVELFDQVAEGDAVVIVERGGGVPA
jgi:lipoprotein-anchoring transpeptidase ErfK/SrfK